MKNSLGYKVLAIIFVIFIFGMFIFNMATGEKSFSEAENRVLQRKPEFTVKSLLDGKFTKNFESYISDQFGFRDSWVRLKTTLEVAMGKRNINGVIIGKDKYLFQDVPKLDGAALEQNIDAINDFSKKLDGININIMLAPDAVKVYEDKLPALVPVVDQGEILGRVKERLNAKINDINILTTLENKKSEYIYYKTDHHWTSLGAYYGYQQILKGLSIEPQSLASFTKEVASTDFYGTQYSKAGFSGIDPDTIDKYTPKNAQRLKVEYFDGDTPKVEATMFDNRYLAKRDKYGVFFGGNHAYIKISNPDAPKRSIVIFKDSYANSVIPFMSADFSDIYVLDMRYFSDNAKKIVDEAKPKDILFLYNVNTFVEDQTIPRILD